MNTVNTLPPQLFFSNHDFKLLKSKFKPAQNNWIKPSGGLWTSTYTDNSSAWVDWCISENFTDPYANDWHIVYPKQNLKIIEIDNYHHCEMLFEKYLSSSSLMQTGLGASLDFEKIAADGFDAIHITQQGEWATRLTRPWTLYGWDCESTSWLKWSFVRKRCIKKNKFKKKFRDENYDLVFEE